MGLPSSVENVAKSGWENVKHVLGDVGHAAKSAWSDAIAEAKQVGRQVSDPKSLTSQLGHTALDAVGLVPVVGTVAQGVNAGWYAAQGDYADAALSGAAAIPVVGDAADAARLTKDGVGIARDAGGIAQDVRSTENIANTTGAGKAVEPGAFAAKTPDPIRPGGGGGDAGSPPRSPDSDEHEYPIGLAYRMDFPRHLAGPDGFTKSGKLYGTHNLENAASLLESRGSYRVRVLAKRKPGYTVTPTGTHGISELRYQVRNPTSGVLKHDAKTVYDPAVHSDQSMLDSALKAGEEAFRQYKANPAKTSFDLTQDGIKFRAHINFETRTGAAYVGNVRPIR